MKKKLWFLFLIIVLIGFIYIVNNNQTIEHQTSNKVDLNLNTNIQLENNKEYIITNATILDNFKSIELRDEITIDGQGNTITYNGTDDWTGLFKPVANIKNVTIKNINLVLGNDNNQVNIAKEQGGILGSSSGINGCKINIENCSVTGNYNIGKKAGGICGYAACYYGECNVNNCYSTG